jgi:glyoxylase-like metal-dependent hydrolase (beta-lactamase superfamily II)
VVGAPADRVVEGPDGFEVDLGGRVLRMLDAPGHARHQFVVHDPASRGFFTGDAFGLSYRELDGPRGPFLFPTTTPVQLDPPALLATVDRMLAERPERMYLAHFGMIEGDVPRAAARLKQAVEEHLRVARAAPAGPGRHAAIRDGLAAQLLRDVAAHGAPVGPAEARALHEVDLELNTQGLEVWLDATPAA